MTKNPIIQFVLTKRIRLYFILLFFAFFCTILIFNPILLVRGGDIFGNNFLEQNDTRILDYILTGHVVEPSTEEYNVKSAPNVDPSIGQASIIKTIFNNKRNGFFVECGALDGEAESNTLHLERDFGWKGVLIEGDPRNFKSILEKHRKSYAVNACLSPLPYPIFVQFKQAYTVGRITKNDLDQELENHVRVPCFPFFSILSALGRKEIDYFSLDIEGMEFQVLKTIPFDEIYIKVIGGALEAFFLTRFLTYPKLSVALNCRVLSVEWVHDPEGKEAIQEYMERKGYRVATMITNQHNLVNDFIFVHKDFHYDASKLPPVVEV